MTEEQVLFYTIGKLASICGLSFTAGWAIVTISGVLSDASTVLADKARKIKSGRE